MNLNIVKSFYKMRYNIKQNSIIKPTTYIYFNTEYEHDNLDDIKQILS